MTFPVYFHLFGSTLHPHPVLEVLAYTGGSQFYFWLRRRQRRQVGSANTSLPIEATLWIIVGCAMGALFGAKTLAWLEEISAVRAELARGSYETLLGGKTIVGGLLGGWIGVEIAKWRMNVRQSTGDLFVFPLIFGIAVGRVGCFLTGLADGTHGNPTSLPWGINFGDGPRHPTQLYEIGWLLLTALLLVVAKRSGKLQAAGSMFRAFLLMYLAYRFTAGFIKPGERSLLGLTAIQWAALVGSIFCGVQLRRQHSRRSVLGADPGATTCTQVVVGSSVDKPRSKPN